MNKNTKRRLEQMKRDGNLVPYVHKKKDKPFPKPDKDVDLSMRTQSLMFHGVNSLHAKK